MIRDRKRRRRRSAWPRHLQRPTDRKFLKWRSEQQSKACDRWCIGRGLTGGYPVFPIDDVLSGALE
jgi:hypothetical protein